MLGKNPTVLVAKRFDDFVAFCYFFPERLVIKALRQGRGRRNEVSQVNQLFSNSTRRGISKVVGTCVKNNFTRLELKRWLQIVLFITSPERGITQERVLRRPAENFPMLLCFLRTMTQRIQVILFLSFLLSNNEGRCNDVSLCMLS